MTTTPLYCEAAHKDSPDGCYGSYEHTGEHEGITAEMDKFWWTDEAEGATRKHNVFLTPEELGILLVALRPVQQFFPELLLKLTDAREAIQ